jgi:hypothetical protein
MPARHRLFRLAVVLLVLALGASCGSSGERAKRNEGRGDKGEACPDNLPIKATKLPSGFTSNVVDGPAQGSATIKNVRIWHYNGPEAKVIEVFRGGQRHKFTKGTPVRALETIARVGKIDGGAAAKLRLGRGRCSRYVYEGRGLAEADLKSIVSGLKRSGSGQ